MFNKNENITYLTLFRILWGIVLFISIFRFIYYDWVFSLFIEPSFKFPYLGWEWIPYFSENELRFLFYVLLISAMGIALGFLYRLFAILFALVFSFIQFYDSANYLNHYYLVFWVSWLLVFLPLNKKNSLDVFFNITTEKTFYPKIYSLILKVQIAFSFM